MRKALREIKDQGEIEALLRRGQVIHLALNAAEGPYVVPMNYGYEDGVIWLHCAREGTRLDLLARDPRAGFSVLVDYAVVSAQSPCEATAHYASVCGWGKLRVVEDEAEKRKGLSVITRQLLPGVAPEFPDAALAATCVLALSPDMLTGKRNPAAGR
ncbi:Pyridoxamine 5'-phosphate oxidase-related protein [Alkalidesulfovibrio alkalitolerans DSM 16529]|jgi:nitroimidazol reductase NimA-like FMN-containing flavoprotein (pyridoxamine 5'-phosphate oxidase superfamily)|uniref:Pyridoxamine 5'-phosphate oxidase-related protein n=1 Tax=Alkalidesulfovibrio alkalitolerans DSM 16529 TaxID=1121439 RepID=S7TBI3_9BACT|nr:pyridoxamine 5'-phosphate oxidase family protein [Alkalidesulfovibrio alkalitolerans]EPR34517.1 Pyridoxamine 5'-phosphate oxidase-related protein [Alkalidesulfovibrio alkalitolerans DSM 16529]